MQLRTNKYKITAVLATHRGLFLGRVNAVGWDRTSSLNCNKYVSGVSDAFRRRGAASYLIRFISSCVLTKDRRKGLDRDREKVR